MPTPQPDTRSESRKAADELLAAEPLQPLPTVAAGETARPLESFLRPRRHPVAVAGVVENGLVRLLDGGVKLAEHTRVIVVASEAG